ncbi:hypothetical protein HY357_01610 [Candidatus Roizmanbacteria bacterium]|nr:hypothetical protein [Candidatus Roizmanbacteria bacterium]
MKFRFRPLYLLIFGNALMIVAIIFKFNRLPPQIPLFYSRALGEDQLADIWMIVLLPLFMNAFYLTNKFLLRRYFQEQILIKDLFYFLNLFITASFTLIFIKIIFVVT